MVIVTARLLDGFLHGFTTRLGGLSAAPFDSLNLGGSVGDAAEHVAANWSRLGEATGLSFARVRQVHGNRVVSAMAAWRPGEPVEEADAVLSTQPGLAACVSVADCVPILLADPRSGSVVAVHAGWRGTLAGAARQAVRSLVEVCGADAGDLLAAIGPSIGPCCFEVSADLADRFRQEVSAESSLVESGASRVDLWIANRTILVSAGLHPGRIETLNRCTACESRSFFSHRRDRGCTGRQVAFIAPQVGM
jgi:polyphenol oxidase